MTEQKDILIPPDKVQESIKTQNVEISKSEKTLLQLAKEELNQITYSESDQLVDPERISSLIEIIKKYEKPILPEGFGEDEFFNFLFCHLFILSNCISKSGIYKSNELFFLLFG